MLAPFELSGPYYKMRCHVMPSGLAEKRGAERLADIDQRLALAARWRPPDRGTQQGAAPQGGTPPSSTHVRASRK